METNEVVLTEREAAALLKISIRKLQRIRKAQIGPPCLQIGKEYRYPKASFFAWIENIGGQKLTVQIMSI